MGEPIEGRFSTGPPFLKLGSGPPLLVASGLTTRHANPTGLARKGALAWCAPFAEHFTVYLANRRSGLEPNSSISDVAADYAGAIEADIGERVHVHGTSTGGSVALQLAIDRPELVKRLVLASCACRLSDHGREVQAKVLELIESGDRRGASALMFGALVPGPMSPLARGAGWLAGGRLDPSEDMRVMIEAEDRFDAEPHLGSVLAPTLVLGGSADPFYSEDLFRRTAAGIPNGKADIMTGKSHRYVAGSKIAAATGLRFIRGLPLR